MLNRISRLAVSAALAACLSLFGQGLTGSISGSVADQSGAPMVGTAMD